MNNLDNWILVVIAVAAVISPIITAIINNIYLLRIKKMELKHQQYVQNIQRIITILENYCKSISSILIEQNKTSEIIYEYSTNYGIAILYTDDNDLPAAKTINELIFNNNFEYSSLLLNDHLLSIRKTINTLRKQH